MRKLIEVEVKNFGYALGKALENCKKSCELYKNDKDAIDNPKSLDELFKMVEGCRADVVHARILQDNMTEWYDIHLVDFRSMLGFSLSPLFGAVGLTIRTLEEENEQ